MSIIPSECLENFMKQTLRVTAVFLFLGALLPLAVSAAVSQQEADQLKKGGSLTPVGAELAGNADKTIPAWTGGMTQAVKSNKANLPGDPFAAEKPLLTINSENAAAHADKLSAGAQYLLKNYPGYRMNIYPTHRTFAAPQVVYDNTYKNALKAHLTDNNLVIKDAHGGIPFPIPKIGEEVMLNDQYNWRTPDFKVNAESWVVSSSGKKSLSSATTLNATSPFYYAEGREDPWGGKSASASLVETTAPVFSAGEKILTIQPRDYVNDQPKAWSYLTGQRRLRKTPNVQYDVPFPYTSGMTNFDDANGFLGAMDRYDWKLVGKQELYVPYNTNGFHLADNVDTLLGEQYANPDNIRWELHRVWVVDATVKAGARHTVPRKRFYVDEDSWWVLNTDQWDAKGQFWKTIFMLPVTYGGVPVTHVVTNLIYNVQSKNYALFSSLNGKSGGIRFDQVTPAKEFTPQALERSGVR
jgi:hypothetical protein